MKTRIAALALALAFVAAPALGAIAGTGCTSCGEMAQSDTPCTALSAASCCGELVPAPPAQTAPDVFTLHALALTAATGPIAAADRAPIAAPEIAAVVSPLRHSVVRRL
jgi:hypothetical protein